MTFGVALEEFLQLIVPIIVRTAERTDISSVPLRKKAMQTLEGLLRRVNLADYASRMIHPLVRIVGHSNNNALRNAALDTLCAILLHIGSDFAIFDPVVQRVGYTLSHGRPKLIFSKAYRETGSRHFRYEELRAFSAAVIALANDPARISLQVEGHLRNRTKWLRRSSSRPPETMRSRAKARSAAAFGDSQGLIDPQMRHLLLQSSCPKF